MRQSRFRRTAVVIAVIAWSAVGTQIVNMAPAVAQTPAFVITQTRPDLEIKPGEKVALGAIVNVQAIAPISQIVVAQLAATPNVQINGVAGTGLYAFSFSTLGELRAATVTVTSTNEKNAGVGLKIYALNSPTDSVPSLSYGTAVMRVVEPPGRPCRPSPSFPPRPLR